MPFCRSCNNKVEEIKVQVFYITGTNNIASNRIVLLGSYWCITCRRQTFRPSFGNNGSHQLNKPRRNYPVNLAPDPHSLRREIKRLRESGIARIRKESWKTRFRPQRRI